MTAMKQRKGEAATSPSDQILSRAMSIQDRKFAFLNQVTRPDYRAVENEMVVSNAPIATPEDEEFSEEEEEKENREPENLEDAENGSETQVVEDECSEENSMVSEISGSVPEIVGNSETMTDVDVTRIVEVSEKTPSLEVSNEEVSEALCDDSEDTGKPGTAGVTQEVVPEVIDPMQSDTASSLLEETIEIAEHVENVESPLEEEIRKMTESFGAPRKAVLERVMDLEDDSDDEELVSPSHHHTTPTHHDRMIFGCISRENTSSAGSSSVYEKPTSLNLISRLCEVEEEDEEEEEPVDGSELPAANNDETVLQQSLVQLQKQLRKSDVRSARLERICQLQQNDIDSLRYEMDWKDKRIEYLQSALEKLESQIGSGSPSSTKST